MLESVYNFACPYFVAIIQMLWHDARGVPIWERACSRELAFITCYKYWVNYQSASYTSSYILPRIFPAFVPIKQHRT